MNISSLTDIHVSIPSECSLSVVFGLKCERSSTCFLKSQNCPKWSILKELSRFLIDEWRWLIVPGEVFYGKCLIGFDLEVQNTYSTIVWKLREHSKKLNPNYSNPGVTQSNHLESPVFLVQSRKPKNIKWPLPSNRRTDQRTERPSCPQGSAVIRCKGQLPNAVPRHTIRLTPRTSCACGHLVRDGWWKIINCIPQRDVVTKSINHPANGQQTLNPRPASRPRS